MSDERSSGGGDIRQLLELARFARPYRSAFLVALAILAVSFVLEMALPYVVRCAIDGPIRTSLSGDPIEGRTLLSYAAAFVVLVGGGAALGRVQGQARNRQQADEQGQPQDEADAARGRRAAFAPQGGAGVLGAHASGAVASPHQARKCGSTRSGSRVTSSGTS